jgi:hypothetical protein
MSISQLPASIRRGAKENSSLILSVGAGVGVITTAYLSAKAGYQTAQALENEDPYEPLKEKAKHVWRLYIPAASSGAVTIVCVAGVKRIDGKKALAAQTALAVSQRAYESYRAQVIEELGEKKDQKFLAKVAEERVKDSPPSTVVVGSGTVLCCEMFTGRYFNSDMESLNRAVNEVNARLLKHDYATMDDFYYIIGLQNTSTSGQCGWEAGKLLELEYSTVLSPDGRPCLSFDYNYVKSF